jgi:hypothetical protein
MAFKAAGVPSLTTFSRKPAQPLFSLIFNMIMRRSVVGLQGTSTEIFGPLGPFRDTALDAVFVGTRWAIITDEPSGS